MKLNEILKWGAIWLTGLLLLLSVQKNARGEKPLHIGGQDYTRGLYCHAFSKIWLADLPFAEPSEADAVSADPPFSFSYDGLASAGLLKGWDVSRSSRETM